MEALQKQQEHLFAPHWQVDVGVVGHVSKRVSEGRTATAVTNLDERARIQELAAMLGTQAKYAREGAASILQQVAQVKDAAGR